MPEPVRIIPLGGLGEVGKNMTAFEYGGRMILIDAGLSFPRSELLGIDLVLPDFSYVAEHADVLDAVILTHGHEDHIGALPYLFREIGTQAEVWGTRLTLGLVKSKLDEHGLLVHTELVEIEPEAGRTRVGPFDAEFVRVTHSVPDAVAVVLHTEHGAIVHTGDFKLDDTPIDGRTTDLDRLRELGDAGRRPAPGRLDQRRAARPHALGADGGRGAPRHRPPGAGARDRDRRSRRTSTGSSRSIDAAAACGRIVSVVGRSMNRNLNIARNLGYATAPDDLLVKPRRLDEFMPHETLILCTGSQGEPRSALTRIAFGDHPAIQISTSDTVVVSARAIPGNEVKVHETVNRLCRLGATVLTEDTTYVNASGHAAADDLSTMLETVRPRAFMPIHGEYRMQQAHARLAEAAGVPAHAVRIAENGTVLELDGDGLSVVGQVEAGTTLVDGMNVGSGREVVLRDRRHLASDGVLIVVATIAADTAEPIAEPEIIARGFIEPSDDGNELLDQARDTVERVLAECQAHRTTEVHLVQQELHDALAELVSHMTGKRPMVLPVVVEV